MIISMLIRNDVHVRLDLTWGNPDLEIVSLTIQFFVVFLLQAGTRMRLSDDNCSLDECFVGGRTLVPLYSGTHFYRFVVTLVGIMRTPPDDPVSGQAYLLCGVDHEGNSSSYDLNGFLLNVVWEPSAHVRGQVAKLHSACGMDHMVKLRRTLINALCRVLFLNRPNVIWIEDGCVLRQDEFYHVEETKDGMMVTNTIPANCPEGMSRDNDVYYSDKAEHHGDLFGLLSSFAIKDSDYISTIMWPESVTTEGKEGMCAFKNILKCAMPRDNPSTKQKCTLCLDP